MNPAPQPLPSVGGSYLLNEETGEWVLQIPERIRARNDDGTFKADDPKTANVNEAWQ